MRMKRQLNVFKHDNWNQMNILIYGKRIVVSEVSSTFGETTHEFLSKGEMVKWAQSYFENEEPVEKERILSVFKRV